MVGEGVLRVVGREGLLVCCGCLWLGLRSGGEVEEERVKKTAAEDAIYKRGERAPKDLK